MAEIANADVELGRIVSVAPEDGVVAAVAADASIVNLLAWNTVTGDATHYAPLGSAGGGGTRRHLFDREIYVDSDGVGTYVNVRAWASITGHPTTVQGYAITNGIRNDLGTLQTLAGPLSMVSTSGGFQARIVGTPGGGDTYLQLLNGTGFAGHYNWQIAKSNTAASALEFARSTSAGATTFASPALKLLSDDSAVFGGKIVAGTDNAYDLGSGSVRWRNGYIAGVMEVATNVTTPLVQSAVGADLSLRTSSAGVVAIFASATGNLTIFSPTTVVQALTTTGITMTVAGAALIATGASTSQKYIELANTGNTGFYFGIEGSAAGGFFTGSQAYESILYSTGNNLRIIQNGGSALFSAGALTITAGITAATGAFSFAGVGSTFSSVGTSATSGTYLNKFFDTNAAAGSAGLAQFVRGGGEVGSITTTLAATAYNTTSDERLKIDRGIASDASILRALKIHEYEWRVDGSTSWGIFAQEAYEVAPWAIHVGRDELDDNGRPVSPWAVDYSRFVPDLIVGWQHHDARMAALEDFRARAIAKFPELAQAA